MAKKKKRGTKKRSGGSMSNLRGGFKGMFSGGKGKKPNADPQQFLYILLALFALFALVFFGTRF